MKHTTTVALPDKKIQLKLVGLDGNAYSLMGAFCKQAHREKWTASEIASVEHECVSSDYDHLLRTLMSVCESPKDEADDE